MRSVLQPPKQSLKKAKPPIQAPLNIVPTFQAPNKTGQKKLVEFRERFQKLRFYFDGVDQATLIKCKAQITKLGGHVDTFLSFNVTHIITGNPEVKEGTQRLYHERKVKSGVPDIVLIAEHLEVKVWPPSKLLTVIETINQNVQPKTQSSLQEALKNEKMFGLSTNRTSTNFKPFKGYFVLIEDPSGAYKPVISKEFGKEYDEDHPPWPVIYYENHAAHTVFALPSQSVQDPTEKSSEEMDPPTKESAASGLISGSVASLMARNPGDNPVIASLTQRTADQVGKRNRDSDDTYPAKKNPQGQKVNVNLIPPKSGYCENCNLKFDDYQKHIQTSKHRRYAENEGNFQTLDLFFKKVERPKAIASIDLDEDDEVDEDYDEEEMDSSEQESFEESRGETEVEMIPIPKEIISTPKKPYQLLRKENPHSPFKKIILRSPTVPRIKLQISESDKTVDIVVDDSESPKGVKRFQTLLIKAPSRVMMIKSDSEEECDAVLEVGVAADGEDSKNLKESVEQDASAQIIAVDLEKEKSESKLNVELDEAADQMILDVKSPAFDEEERLVVDGLAVDESKEMKEVKTVEDFIETAQNQFQELQDTIIEATINDHMSTEVTTSMTYQIDTSKSLETVVPSTLIASSMGVVEKNPDTDIEVSSPLAENTMNTEDTQGIAESSQLDQGLVESVVVDTTSKVELFVKERNDEDTDVGCEEDGDISADSIDPLLDSVISTVPDDQVVKDVEEKVCDGVAECPSEPCELATSGQDDEMNCDFDQPNDLHRSEMLIVPKPKVTDSNLAIGQESKVFGTPRKERIKVEFIHSTIVKHILGGDSELSDIDDILVEKVEDDGSIEQQKETDADKVLIPGKVQNEVEIVACEDVITTETHSMAVPNDQIPAQWDTELPVDVIEPLPIPLVIKEVLGGDSELLVVDDIILDNGEPNIPDKVPSEPKDTELDQTITIPTVASDSEVLEEVPVPETSNTKQPTTGSQPILDNETTPNAKRKAPRKKRQDSLISSTIDMETGDDEFWLDGGRKSLRRGCKPKPQVLSVPKKGKPISVPKNPVAGITEYFEEREEVDSPSKQSNRKAELPGNKPSELIVNSFGISNLVEPDLQNSPLKNLQTIEQSGTDYATLDLIQAIQEMDQAIEEENDNEMREQIEKIDIDNLKPIGKLTKSVSLPTEITPEKVHIVRDAHLVISDSEANNSPTSSVFSTPMKPFSVDGRSPTQHSPIQAQNQRIVKINRQLIPKSPLTKVLNVSSMDELSSPPEQRTTFQPYFPTHSNGIPIVQSARPKNK